MHDDVSLRPMLVLPHAVVFESEKRGNGREDRAEEMLAGLHKSNSTLKRLNLVKREWSVSPGMRNPVAIWTKADQVIY